MAAPATNHISGTGRADAFRTVMAGVATPVTVVTSIEGDIPHGTTVSAFASLSMNPPMCLVSLDRESDLLALVRRTKRFGVNVLGVTGRQLAWTFAGKGGTTKFDGVAWSRDNDLPRLPDAPGWLACEVASFVDGGDHVVLFGNVVAAEQRDGKPLTYQSRLFGTHAPLAADQ